MITNNQRFNQPCLRNEAAIKIPEGLGLGSVHTGEHVEALAVWHTQKGHGSLVPPPYTLPYASLPFGYSGVVFFEIHHKH